MQKKLVTTLRPETRALIEEIQKRSEFVLAYSQVIDASVKFYAEKKHGLQAEG